MLIQNLVAFYSLPFSVSLLLAPRSMKAQEPFGVPSMMRGRPYPVCADSVELWLEPVPWWKWNEGNGVGTLPSAPSCLYYYSKWLKPWQLFLCRLVLISYSNTCKVSSIQLSWALDRHLSNKFLSKIYAAWKFSNKMPEEKWKQKLWLLCNCA